jgi:hypothetical protein
MADRSEEEDAIDERDDDEDGEEEGQEEDEEKDVQEPDAGNNGEMSVFWG